VKVSATLPSRVLGEWSAVKVVAEGERGSFCLKPRHVDWVGVLGIGITEITLEGGEEVFMAHDSGILVKRGDEVKISVRRGLVSDELDLLEETVDEVFRHVDEQEAVARSAASKLEVGFVRRFLKLKEGLRG